MTSTGVCFRTGFPTSVTHGTAALHAEVAKGLLKTWPLGEPVLSRNLYLVRPADRPMSNAVRAIEELAYATLVRLVREGVWSAELAQNQPDTAVALDDAPHQNFSI